MSGFRYRSLFTEPFLPQRPSKNETNARTNQPQWYFPLVLSFDTTDPMARSVYDVGVALSVMTGVDKADTATFEKTRRPYQLTDCLGEVDLARLSFASQVRDFMSFALT